MTQNNFFTRNQNELTINILATASSKKDSFWKVVWDRIKISVKKAAENGEATAYMKKFIAKEFWVSNNEIELLYWETSREKAFKITTPKKIPENLKDLIDIKL